MAIELSKKQRQIVDYKGQGFLVVKGTAGSGKTLVGLHRAEAISADVKGKMFNDGKKVMVMTYNNSLINEIKDKYEELFGKDKNVEFKTYDKFFYGFLFNLFRQEHPKFFITGFDEECFAEPTPKDRASMPDKEWAKREPFVNFFKQKAAELGLEYDFLVEETRYIMANGFDEQTYLTVLRRHRKIRLVQDMRKKIFAILKEYRKMMFNVGRVDANDMYNWYLRKLKEYKRTNQYEKEKKLYEEEKERFESMKKNQISAAGGEENLEFHPTQTLYSLLFEINSIIIDESQDLSKLKVHILFEIADIYSNIENITFLYDTSQTIYPNSYFATLSSFKSIGIGREQQKMLEFSYRSTRQIHQCAYDLLSKFEEKDADDEVSVKPVFGQSDEGIKPILIQCPSVDDEGKLLADTIKTMQDKYGYSNNDMIGIIQDCKKYREYMDILAREGIQAEYLDRDTLQKCTARGESIKEKCKGKIRFYNPYNVKGLEAKVVFVAGNSICDNKKTDEEIAKYYYVQMTRAMELLFIFSPDEPNKFIQSIDEKYLCRIDYDESASIGDVIDGKIKLEKEALKKNRVKRYEGVQKRVAESEKEEEKKRIEIEKKEKELLKTVAKSEKKPEDYFAMAKKEMPQLPENIITNIGLGLYYRAQGIDYETAYSKFAKAIELALKLIYPESELTMGQMIANLRYDKDYKGFIQDISKKKLVEKRNIAIHGMFNVEDHKALETIFKYVYEDKEIVKLYNKICSVKQREAAASNIKKTGLLFTKGYRTILDKKELYSYLINDEEYACCKTLIPNGRYSMTGRIKKVGDKEIYIIDKYELVQDE